MKPSTELTIGRIRGRVPGALLPTLVDTRTRLAWRSEAVRKGAREQMRFLVEHTRPDLDLDTVARDYVRYQALRGETRWRPQELADLEVQGLHHLTSAHKPGRGLVISFMHHAFLEGGFASLGRLGVQPEIVTYGYMLRDDAPGWLQQHVAVATSTGAKAIAAERGADDMARTLRTGGILAIASDVPGRTPLRFCGRDVVGSFGAARLAAATGSPVVVMTSERRDDGSPRIVLHEAFDPEAFPNPHKLLEATVAVHENAQICWPEAADIPLSRWALPDAGGSTTWPH
jgi:lauroyl/myristoyl acyltransferase